MDPVPVLEDHLGQVLHVQAKDVEIDPAARKPVRRLRTAGRQAVTLGERLVARYRIPGLGQVDWAGVLRVLREGGYDGVVSVEHEDPVWSGDRRRVHEGLVIAERTLVLAWHPDLTLEPRKATHAAWCLLRRLVSPPACYHPSLPPRRLRMVDDLVDFRATVLVWASMGGGSLALPYLEQEAFGPVDTRSRFYGFVNDSEFIAACHEQGIKVLGVVFEAQGWEFPVELTEDEDEVLAINELRGAEADWRDCASSSPTATPSCGRPVEHYFPDGLVNSDGERVGGPDRGVRASATSTSSRAMRTGWSAPTVSTSASTWTATTRSGAST